MLLTTPSQPGAPLHEHIQLRAMQEKDLHAVHNLEKICQPFPWPAWYFRRQLRVASCWVLEHNGMVVGFGIVAMVKHWAHIMNMCIAPGYRRCGQGRRIMLHLLKVARQHYATHAWLEVRPSNYPAITLYRKLGFRKKQVREKYYPRRGGRENGLVMVRLL
ncbi:MAG: ribosomal protein S18-alanine N-acetyltransferase [Thioalkalispiraceae bacterium]